MIDLDVIFLAGGPRRSPLELELHCPLYCLPISEEQSLLEAWVSVVEQSASESSSFRLSRSRLVLSDSVTRVACHWPASIELVIEPQMHRGTAGVVRDVLAETAEGTAVLVVELSASPRIHLAELLRAWHLERCRARHCILGESALRRYCGVLLCDRSAFDLVPPVGFVDLKEQFLPMLTASGGEIDSVIVADRARRVRTHREWLALAGLMNAVGAPAESPVAGIPKMEEGANLIRPGAITAGATVVSSIVMDDAVVAPGALVARSIIGPGVTVKAGSRVIDAVVGDPAGGVKALSRLIVPRDERVKF